MTNKLTKQFSPEKPVSISITELSQNAFAQASVFIRDGYVFSESIPPEFFGYSGQVNLTLVLGDLDSVAIAAAAHSQLIALERQQFSVARNDAAALAQTEAFKIRELAKAVAAEELTAAKALVKHLEKLARSA